MYIQIARRKVVVSMFDFVPTLGLGGEGWREGVGGRGLEGGLAGKG